jgi:hypothetical protein
MAVINEAGRFLRKLKNDDIRQGVDLFDEWMEGEKWGGDQKVLTLHTYAHAMQAAATDKSCALGALGALCALCFDV